MFFRQLFLAVISAALLAIFSCPALAQGFKQELEAPEKVELTVRNLDGRVSVVASDEQNKKVTIDARSSGLAIEPSDVKVEAKGANIANYSFYFCLVKTNTMAGPSGLLTTSGGDNAGYSKMFQRWFE